MTELTDSRGHYVAAGNVVIALGMLALLLTLVTTVFGLAASTPPGLAVTGALFVVVGGALRRSW